MRKRKVHSSTQHDSTEEVYLRRQLGLLSSMSFIVGTVVGSGIFVAPKGVLLNTGSVGLSLVMWAVCGFISLFGALCFAELGTTFTKSGGSYLYALETLGPLPAFIRLWLEFLFIRPSSSSFVAMAFGKYLMEPFYAPCSPPLPLVKLIGALAVTFVTTVNCWSVKLAYTIQVVLTISKVFAMAMIIVPGVLALLKGHTKNFEGGFELDLSKVERWPLAVFSGLFAYGGWFYLNFVREEVVNPNRNIPLAMTLSMMIVTFFYVLVNLSYYTILSPEELMQSEAVAATFATRTLYGVAPIVPIIVALSCLGALNGGMFGSPRMLFVGAREGQWPHIFSMIHIRRRTPLPAVLMLFPMMLLMTITGEIDQLLVFASFSRWFFFFLTVCGMIIHRYRFPLLPRPFKVPMVVAIIFLTVTFAITVSSIYSDPWNTGGSFCFALTGVPVYYLTVDRFRLPLRWKKTFDHWSEKLQILMEVVKQEVQTF